MGDYNIDINVNMGGSAGNFQDLIASMNNLNASFQKVGTASKEAGDKSKQSFSDSARIMKRFGNDVKEVSAIIAGYRQKIVEQGVALKQGTIIQTEHDKAVTRYAAKIQRLTDVQRQYNAVLGQTTAQAKATSNGLANLSAVFNKLGAVLGVSFGLYGVIRAFTATIKTISDFELSQKKLQSILAISWKDMEALRKAAINLGGASIFGAKGVSELQIELAKMGFAKQDIVDMEAAIVNLATATQEDLTNAAMVVASVLRAYKMEATDATMVTDIMGKAFNDSALDLANFTEAIKYVGPIAKQAGFTFAETTALLETLANSGIKGSLAGTSLTNIISRLGDENSKFSKTLGRTVKGSDDFIKALIELKSKGADLADVFQLVDRRAAATFTILLQGVTTVEQFNQKLRESSGVISTQAAVQMESLTFKTRQLKNEFESLVLAIDSGDSALSRFLKHYIDLASNTIQSYTQTTAKSVIEAYKIAKKEGDMLGTELPESLRTVNKRIGEVMNDFIKANQMANDAFAVQARKKAKAIMDDIAEYRALSEKKITEAANRNLANTFATVSPKMYGDVIAGMQIQLGKLKETSYAYRLVAESIKILTVEYEKYLKTLDLDTAKKSTEADAISKLRKKLEFEKQVALESVKLKYDGDEQKRRISQVTFFYDKKIAEETLSVDEGKNEAIRLAELKLANDRKDISQKLSIDLLKIQQSRNENLINSLDDGFEKEQALMKSNYEYGLKILEQNEIGNDNFKEKLADYNEKYFLKVEDAERKHAIEVLKIQEELNQLMIEINFEGYEEELKLRESAMKSEIAILVERNLATEEHNKEYEKIQLKYKALTVKDEVAFQKELTQLVYEGEILRGDIEGNSLNIRREAINKWFDFESSKLDKTAVNFDQAMKNLVAQKELKFKELEQGKSLYELLFPDAGGAELAAMEESVGIITDNISKIADSWVDATDKIVDQYNRRVDEAAKALDTEVALMAAGYASNVTLKKKELDELKKQRDKALDEQQRAQKAQLIINSAMQASDLALTVAGLFKSGVKLAGIPGLLIAAAASASLFAMFKSFQNLAKQQSAVKFEKGGWIGGERHSRGGTHIEAERGEFVVRRNSAIKHKSLIEAINSDNQYEMNRIYLNKVKGQIFSGKVSLDDSKDLKAIRALMEKQGKTVEYSGSYRIEKVGNITTKIRLN